MLWLCMSKHKNLVVIVLVDIELCDERYRQKRYLMSYSKIMMIYK